MSSPALEANRIILGDNLEVLRSMPSQCVDLVLTSPPYEKARTLGINFSLSGQEWVDWCVERYVECLRVCRGLVAWVVEGQTRKFRYSAVPALLMADLHRRGVHLRKPPIFHRVGIPGSGGPDFLRNDYESVVCATNGGKLPWSDNTAMGHPPKWAPGGAMSNRTADGQRKNANGSRSMKARYNQWGHSMESVSVGSRDTNGVRNKKNRPSHRGTATKGSQNGDTMTVSDGYDPPTKANPGNKQQHLYTAEQVAHLLSKVVCDSTNVISCIVGGGVMGSRLAHENEAPFPEALAEFYIRSFCPPAYCRQCGVTSKWPSETDHLPTLRQIDSPKKCPKCSALAVLPGIVLDPFCGSGTTLAVSEKLGRQWLGIEVRESQVELSQRRVAEKTK